jgi:RNA polymerase sigma factor (TIGR02999 family)
MAEGTRGDGTAVTRLISAAAEGDRCASAELLPFVYKELRRLARQKLKHESAGQTLQATALVHEAYLRLVGKGHDKPAQWDSRRHFFAAAAEAMRRILIDRARERARLKRGGGARRVALDDIEATANLPIDQLLALDEALERLAERDPPKAELVKLRYFAGLSMEEASNAMDISTATAERYWRYARAWLYRQMNAS